MGTEDEIWVFGYGSLVWRPDFVYLERVAGSIDGWARRFWQGSTDHRGVPEAPGRVVTLIAQQDAECGGVAYQLDASSAAQTMHALDVREQGGYEMQRVRCRLVDGRKIDVDLYIATESNANYLGPASALEIAEQVLRSQGPSGPNREYVLELANALDDLGLLDEHVAEVAALVRRLQGTTD